MAADVLYAGMDGLFARTLASHLPSSDEMKMVERQQQPPDAIIACPFRTDSPLLNFFAIAERLGLSLYRLENKDGAAAGSASGTSASKAFNQSEFVPVGDRNSGISKSRWEMIAKEPQFSPHNRDKVQIFRVNRVMYFSRGEGNS